nr:type II toxin-antitoxin system RelE/ParE family toxin [Mucilaginibacter sp. FT3.2]
MRVVIEDDYLAKLYQYGESRGKPKFGPIVESAFIRRVIQIEQALDTNTLRQIKSLLFEQLKGDLKGKVSIRVIDGFRLIFRVENDGNNKRIEIIAIEELSNHYSK